MAGSDVVGFLHPISTPSLRGELRVLPSSACLGELLRRADKPVGRIGHLPECLLQVPAGLLSTCAMFLDRR
jgi:hypothetical protein